MYIKIVGTVKNNIMYNGVVKVSVSLIRAAD